VKIISFSLWGQNPKYLVGAIKNAELALEIYPEWKCRYYLGTSVPRGTEMELESFSNVEIINRPEWGDWRGMFWRFLPAGESNVEVMISRDTDSRLSQRERHAVDEWLESDKGFHIMRDHPHHRFPVLGGMWGAKRGTLPDIHETINNFAQSDKYGTDYEFFATVIMPQIINNVFIHDEFFDGERFPTPREKYEFVGEVFNENNETVEEHTQALISF
jgi:hypothetical protein